MDVELAKKRIAEGLKREKTLTGNYVLMNDYNVRSRDIHCATCNAKNHVSGYLVVDRYANIPCSKVLDSAERLQDYITWVAPKVHIWTECKMCIRYRIEKHALRNWEDDLGVICKPDYW